MAWTLDADRPIYTQIVEIIQRQIVSGEYKPGDKMPSVRDMATEAGVNPNTMQRAYAQLEMSGLVETQRTTGRNVTENRELIRSIQEELATQETRDYVDRMQGLGYDTEGIVQLIKDVRVEERE